MSWRAFGKRIWSPRRLIRDACGAHENYHQRAQSLSNSKTVDSALEEIRAASRAARPRIVLAEGEDPRVVEGAAKAVRDRLAEIVLLGSSSKTDAMLSEAGMRDAIEIRDPASSEQLDDYAQAYFEMRKHKGIDSAAARRAVAAPLGFAAMAVRQGHAEGTIAGAVATTRDTVRTALQVIGRSPGSKVVSSYFLMLLREPFLRSVVFADCALIIMPTAEELASIAIASARSFTEMTGLEPRVAMLSFSTMGSAEHESVSRVREAVSIAREQNPDLVVDGEIQFDAAIMPDIAARKAPGSALEGQANVFIFPNLSAGNIGYKIAQRIGGATALGPILQGLARPANDLSRGCSSDDVYKMIAVTGAQAAAARKNEQA